MSSRNKKVRVWGRFRPTANFAHENIELLPDNKGVNVHMRRDPKKGVVNNQILDWSFKLDGIFSNADQDTVYNTVASDIVRGSLDGYNGTLMCYGQTGAGKTFTITGATESYRHRGLIPRAISQLFKQIEERLEYSITVRVSYMEIYNEGMFDLLSSLPEATWNNNSKDPYATPDPMVVTENQDGVFVKGLSCHLAQNEEEALNLLFEGETNRSIAAHQLNKQSSRSHCIFTVYLESRSRTQSNAKYTVSKVNFVDLAGSERLSKSKSEGKTKEEAMYINKSLSFLEQVVIALASRTRDHVPFRQSKLTHYLKDSIGGNCNTLLVANMWGEPAQLEETVSTLRFATRMMCVASEPAVNEVYDPALLVKKLQREIQHLKSELAMHDTLTNRSMVWYDPLSEQQKYEIRTQVKRYLDGSLDEIDIVNIRQIVGTFESFRELYLDMEKDMEARLKEKYMLIDKNDPASIAAAQQAGVPIADDGSLVGDLEGGNFGLGTAPKTSKADSSAVVQLKKKERERDRKRGSRGATSPVAGKTASSPSHSAKGERKIESPTTPGGERADKPEKDLEGSASPVSSAGNLSRSEKVQRPSRLAEDAESGVGEEGEEPAEEEEEHADGPPTDTPPSRTSAFEDFKAEKGSEINRVLIGNKEELAKRKKAYSDLAKDVNNIKVSIDQTRQKLEQLRQIREAEGPILNEDGDIIISEEEFMEIQRLKDLKISYRSKYDQLHNGKSEVVYCQNMVDQCRLKLIQEFDNWYSESFLSATDESQTSLGVGIGGRPGVIVPITSLATEDEQEKFERLQLELMMNNPDSAAFYNAQMRTSRRKIYGSAMSQAQPAYRHQPGTPTKNVLNRPPNMLQVQY
ncbi:kinesin-like protein KIF9 isoform X3 [Aplysia californica]|uniref:Kinesin-like protein n=1 Tax=Aplysia californica TaxID=6500 RepID=A0ABM0K927_APLCA|nr:kinesin-like protein KIF9 isoform X3 [Aplysia californica]